MRLTLTLLMMLTLALPAAAWNFPGHRIIAAIAYDKLTPATRARVDELLRRHPDYAMFTQDAPADPVARARAAFINSSVWPDQIRNDPRFTPEQRHTDWHYTNISFSQDGTPTRPAPTPNVVTEIERLSRAIDPYAMPWLIHLVGDLHNPIHAVARFSKQDPMGDRGGNSVFVEPHRNLHAFWDNLPGEDPMSAAEVDRFARVLSNLPAPNLRKTPADWAKEGVDLAKKSVYGFGKGSGTQDQPIHLSEKYQSNAKSIGRKRLADAGFRLAALLNRQLP